MRLFIAEKPSLGRAIAEALPGPYKKSEGAIRCSNGDVVTWCVGHLLEQAEPDAYDGAYKQWRLEHLPIIPQQWILQPRNSVRGQLKVIRELLKKADIIVHAGDPDREGQLLVDEVLDHLKLSATRKRQVQRLLISDLTPAAIKRALAQMQSNQNFVSLSVSALARARADWLYGINLTRACTLLGRQAGADALLSVGRVQTPVLGLVVRRDQEIDAFQPKPFYEVLAHVKTTTDAQFAAKWLPSDSCQPWMDDEGRVLDRRLAENVIRRITDKPAVVKSVSNKPKTERPPLPYSLSALQIDAAKALRMNAQTVLDICQQLYEKKLITYPRSDCRYLPQEHFSQSAEVLAAIRSNVDGLTKAVDGADTSRKSPAWNDSKVTAHHAIIPTSLRSRGELTGPAEKIYTIISRRYVMQFYPDHRSSQYTVELLIENGLFKASQLTVLEPGWKALQPASTKEKPAPTHTLPPLQKGDRLHCERGELVEKVTTPPKPFDDATLLMAMTGISRYVQDAGIRQILKETDGLGTEATRAGIIELLFKRQFLQRVGKQIHATPTGKSFINALPEALTLPDVTARWESILGNIVDKRAKYHDFMTMLEGELQTLLTQTISRGLGTIISAPNAGQRFKKRGGGGKRNYRKTATQKH